MTPIVVAFGSNLGDRGQNIAEAIKRLGALMSVERVSHSYETAPMYVEDQPHFLNGVVSGQTTLGPIALVKGLKEIEKQVGRVCFQGLSLGKVHDAQETLAPDERDHDAHGYEDEFVFPGQPSPWPWLSGRPRRIDRVNRRGLERSCFPHDPSISLGINR